MKAAFPADEAQRLATLYALDLVDRAGSATLERLVRLATKALDMPIAMLTLIDAEVQWCRVRQGFEPSTIPRAWSFCAHAILSPELMVVEDALADVRFFDNPMVIGPPGIRFYAGRPICAPNGVRLGALCVMDTNPRVISEADCESLEDLASLAEDDVRAVALDVFDATTGLVNRRGLQLVADQAISRALREGESLSLVLIDLGGGEVAARPLSRAGDDALVALARVLRACLRGSDVPARFRSDEFVVLLPDTAGEQGRVVAKRVMDGIRQATGRDAVLRATHVRVGCATIEPSDEPFTLEALIEQADASA